MPHKISHSRVVGAHREPEKVPWSVPSLHPWIGYLRDGQSILVRPACGDDAPLERDFVRRLTPEVFDQCSLGLIQPDRDELVRELVRMDVSHDMGLLGLVEVNGQQTLVGLARFRGDPQRTRCDCTVAVDPLWRERGVGSILMHHLIGIARMRGIRKMFAVDAFRDAGAHALARRLGFRPCPDPDDPAAVTFELELQA